MKTWIEMVTEFNKANGYEPAPSFTLVPVDTRLLRIRLMMEELGELTCAIHENDTVEIADGITDLLYVVIGTAIDYGMGGILEELFAEVQRSNMSKDFAEQPDGRKGGIKGPRYSPANIVGILTKEIDRRLELIGTREDDDIPF